MNKFIYKILSILPDSIYLKLQYRYNTGNKLNLKEPTRYNEKLQWLKIYDHNPHYTELVDKYLVKKIVSKKIGRNYIIPTIGVWDTPKQININSLPDQFVLKCNHDSKSVYVIKDKSKVDFEKILYSLDESLKTNHYYYGREWPYKNVKPLVFAEEYKEDDSGGLLDYKVMCFNGKPMFVQLHQGRFTDNYTQDFFDSNWNHQSFNQIGEVSSKNLPPKPVFLEEMLKLSEILSESIPHVRIDWYYADNQLYFGEYTFFDASGYFDYVPDEYNYILGDYIDLPR